MTGTGEPEDRQLARNVSELLGGLRVAQAGVQILFGFLLAVVFTEPFRQASGFEKTVHLVTVLFTAAASALLTAPVVWHRVLFRTGRRTQILRVGNKAVIAGLACLAIAITLTVSLIAKVVYGPIAMGVLGGTMAVMFVGLWFVVPRRL